MSRPVAVSRIPALKIRRRSGALGPRLPLPSGQPLHPGTETIYPGLTLTRCHQRFTHVHPSDLPLTRGPRMVQGPLRLSPELRTPPLPATHVRSGDRATNTYPGYVIDNTADLHSTRHLHMRPRVAPPAKCLPASITEP